LFAVPQLREWFEVAAATYIPAPLRD
jgi:hypothetical protein